VLGNVNDINRVQYIDNKAFGVIVQVKWGFLNFVQYIDNKAFGVIVQVKWGFLNFVHAVVFMSLYLRALWPLLLVKGKLNKKLSR